MQPSFAVEAPQEAPPTANFVTTLAQQRQQALEKMEFGAAEREDTEMDGNVSDGSSTSNPVHPWNVSAPTMAHQGTYPLYRIAELLDFAYDVSSLRDPVAFPLQLASSNSLSNSSTASSSMPGTPLDGVFNYSTTSSSYPSHSNPTSFTDMNGNTITFASTSPPVPSFTPPPNPSTAGPVSHGFVAQAYANAQAKQQQDSQPQGYSAHPGAGCAENDLAMQGDAGMAQDGGVNETKPMNQPTATYGYGWDYPRQSNCFAMGGHLV